MTNMITSIDGSFSVDGVSGPLGSAADKALLSELRQHADLLLVGRKTAEFERYHRRGSRIALVTSSPQSCIGSRLFEPAQGPEDRLPVIVTGANPNAVDTGLLDTGLPELRSLSDPGPAILYASRGRRGGDTRNNAGHNNAGHNSAGHNGETRNNAGRGGVDFLRALRTLGHLGAKVVLCEGGPTIYAQLLAEDLVDEINWTISPMVARRLGEPTAKVAATVLGNVNRFQLTQLASEDDYLFLRYVRADRALPEP